MTARCSCKSLGKVRALRACTSPVFSHRPRRIRVIPPLLTIFSNCLVELSCKKTLSQLRRTACSDTIRHTDWGTFTFVSSALGAPEQPNQVSLVSRKVEARLALFCALRVTRAVSCIWSRSHGRLFTDGACLLLGRSTKSVSGFAT
jgi:hypothetical protein